MQSYSASDGTYTLTVTFKIGTDLNFAQVLVQNRVSSALSQLPTSVQNQGVTVQKKSTSILLFVTLTSPDSTVRQPVLEQLRHHQPARRAVPPARRRQRHGVRRRPVFDADLARSEQAAGARIGAAGRHPGDPAAEPAGLGRPGRRAADTAGSGVPVHAQRQRPARRHQPVREHHRQVRHQRRRHAGARRRLGRARRADLQPDLLAQQAARRRHRRVPVARRQRARGRAGRREEDGGACQGLPARHEVRHAVRHHEIRASLGARGLHDADRGRPARAGRDPGVPAGLARDAGAGDDRAGDHHRRVRRDGGARLHHQHVDAVCDRAGDRHRRRRRHRRGRRRRPQYRAGHERPRRRDQGDGPAVRADRRHHPGADLGVPAGLVPRRPHRADLFAIRAGDRGDRAAVRHQRGDAEADAMRAVAAADGAAGAAQLLLSRLQRRLQPRRARLYRG